jgi:4-amino-4-deoxychorismate lyase
MLWGCENPINLDEWIAASQPPAEGLYKCRVRYGPNPEGVEIEPYRPRAIRTLRLLLDNHVNYAYKYEDRRALERLFAQRAGCDDILIVKNGHITDTSYSNIAFFDGRHWVTPERPLLAGTTRARLLAEGALSEAPLRPSDLPAFHAFRLLNAMLDWDDQPPQPIGGILA